MPRIDVTTVPARQGSGYPNPFDAPCSARAAVAWAKPAGFATSAST